MIWLALLIISVGLLIAALIIQMPNRLLRLMNEAELRKARIENLEARLSRLVEMRTQSCLIFEGARHRVEIAFQHEEVDFLSQMRAECDVLLTGLHEVSPILERYFQNHIAVLNYVLGGYEGKSSLPDALQAALSDIERAQAAERSSQPIAVLERKLATGRDA